MSEQPTPIPFDVLIIGGGVNGCGIARDAAGRGLRTLLCEKNDLASGTSSKSTKLIHGGLRYLEHYDFKLVRESLIEREKLWGIAPHIISPMRFVLPHNKALRPAWLVRTGLFIYDHIGGRKLLPPTRTLDLTRDSAGGPLKSDFSLAFEYSDCWVDDARLVVLNAVDAAQHGATILTRTKFINARQHDDLWLVDLQLENQKIVTVPTRALVNAAGPWVDEVRASGLDYVQDQSTENSSSGGKKRIRLVQGSHIVTKRIFDHDRAYFFQNEDKRIIFAIPYEEDFTLIGTTDREFDTSPDVINVPEDAVDYLCAAASTYFKQRVTPDQVVWSYSGVRALYDDGASAAQEATRDYVISYSRKKHKPVLANIFGGKITTYRRLSEEVTTEICERLATGGTSWTGDQSLPGGDFGLLTRSELAQQIRGEYSFMSHDWVTRMVRAYGTDTRTILGRARSAADLGTFFGANLYAAEVDYLAEKEWARTAEDILWRRSKLGLQVTQSQTDRLQHYLNTRS